jgi:very-short-patch-repair endonuclease
VIRAADARAANPFESVLRAIASEVAGFCAEPQGRVPRVGHADVADVRLRIALEAESWEFHALREAFNYDIRRYTAMVRCGWLVARFTWDDVMHKPDYVRAVIADLVAIRARVQEIRAVAR